MSVDLTQIAVDLARAGEMSGKSLDDLILSAANSMYAEILPRVPVDTGNLRAAMQVIATPGKVSIGPDLTKAPYAWMVHDGTRAHTIKPKTAKVLRFQAGGKVVYTREVKHPGTRAQPYMTEGLEAWMNRLTNDAVNMGVELALGMR